MGCTGGCGRDSRSHLLVGIQACRIGSARGLFGAGRVGPSVVLPFLLEPRSAPPVLSPASMMRGRRREVPCHSLLTPCRAPPVLLPAVSGVRVGARSARPFDGVFLLRRRIVIGVFTSRTMAILKSTAYRREGEYQKKNH